MTRTYPHGVTSWIDIEHHDLAGARAFYGALFGWTFNQATPPEAPVPYFIALLNGQDAAGMGSSSEGISSGWNTYVAIQDAQKAVAKVEAAGGNILQPPSEAGEGGTSVVCADPLGVQFRLWQARRRPGAQVVNTPGAWNFSDLYTGDADTSKAFYSSVFGWQFDDMGFATMIRVPGYGDHLESTSDPEIRARQAGINAPPGFADAIGWLSLIDADETPHWHVSFTVADRDETAHIAEHLGGDVLQRNDSEWTRDALIRDPQGGIFTASQFTPP